MKKTTANEIEAQAVKVGDRVVFHGRHPWHNYFATVTGEDLKHDELGTGRTIPAWIIVWEGDQYFPDRAGVEGRMPKYVSLNAFHPVAKEVK
jgi:hypothetical protein